MAKKTRDNTNVDQVDEEGYISPEVLAALRGEVVVTDKTIVTNDGETLSED